MHLICDIERVMKIPVKNINLGVVLCVAAWLYAVFNPGIHKNAFTVLVFWWAMGATAINYSLWKMQYSPYQRYPATGLRLGLLGFTVVCLGGLLGRAADMEAMASIVFKVGLGFAVLGILVFYFGLIKNEQ